MSAEVSGRRASRSAAATRRFPRIDGAWVALTAIALVGLVLRALMPPLLRWGNQHDDFAQVSITAALLRGEWLGEWGAQGVPHITLAKGPGYPFFLALIEPTGLPPQVASYLIYLAGSLLVARALGRHLGRWWSVVIFGVLAFNPVVFGSAFSVVYRDALIAALAPVALGLGLDIAWRLTRPGRWGWRGWSILVVDTLLLTATFGWVTITRADIIWIVFGSIGGLIVGLIPHLRRLGRRGWISLGAGAVAVTVGVAAVPATIAQINEREYGVHLVDDYSEGTFAEAVTLWSSVIVPDPEHYENVSRAQRAAVYEVSPTAALLQDDLEAPDQTWITRNCTWHEDIDLPCDDYGSYFTWVLRDASIRTGGVSSAAEFQEFFGKIADEIQAACDSGELTCGMRGLSADVPPLDRMPVRVAVANLFGFVEGALTFDGARPQLQKVPAENADIATWQAAVNGTDTVLDAMNSGQSPDAFGQQSVGELLVTIYSFLIVPALLMAVGALFWRRMWRSSIGWTAIVLVCAWLGNLAIVSVFYAGTNRSPGSKMPLYTMASQSYLLLGLTLACAVVLHGSRDRIAGWLGRRTDSPADDAA